MAKDDSTSTHSKNDKDFEIATLANGCFWCTEAIFSRVKGIKSVIPGYSGGKTSNPSYKQVCTGITGHAEAIQIEYDPKIISFEKILNIFWHTHDQMSKVKLEFYAEIQETDGVSVILIPSSLSGIARGLKGLQRKCDV